MPTPLAVRRERRFRPINYTARHRLVVQLYALGKRREEIAKATGLSVWHISRVLGMTEARADSESMQTWLGQQIVELATRRLLRRIEKLDTEHDQRRSRGRRG